ncbi:hypothetical protein SLS60_009667 [Paraconiothyrium brasiliense]|uniref:Uncharacterized protein n=1 Tax=Paraconiothyrium brasiliense TaxID=300254 RepID=A0ABR3QW24_9PLEO
MNRIKLFPMYSSTPPTDGAAADKIALETLDRQATADENLKGEVVEEEGEVFRSDVGHAEYRALGW